MVDGELKPIWFTGARLPTSLVPGSGELSEKDVECEAASPSSNEESSDEDD